MCEARVIPRARVHGSPWRQSPDILRSTCETVRSHSSPPPPRSVAHMQKHVHTPPWACVTRVHTCITCTSPCSHTCMHIAHTTHSTCATRAHTCARTPTRTPHTMHTHSRRFPGIRAPVSLPYTDVICETPQCAPLSGVGGDFTRSRPFPTHASGEEGVGCPRANAQYLSTRSLASRDSRKPDTVPCLPQTLCVLTGQPDRQPDDQQAVSVSVQPVHLLP